MSPEPEEDAGSANLATSVKAKLKRLQELQAQTETRAKEVDDLGAGLAERERSLAERATDLEQREKAEEESLRAQAERIAGLQKREEQITASEQSLQLELKRLAQQKKSLAERERTLAEAERSLADWLEPNHADVASAIPARKPQEAETSQTASTAPAAKKAPHETEELEREIPPPPEVPEPPASSESPTAPAPSRPAAVAPSTTGRRAVIGRLNQAITIARKLKDEGHDVLEVRELLRSARAALDRMDYDEVGLLTDAILEALASVKVH